ncbi:MAG TPA: sigma-70 family RNA polymerase sigma factor [Terriglobales bacterium]|nr:sigma-70 family RNA polymerase sigma factor [Terriglobales bacterium]
MGAELTFVLDAAAVRVLDADTELMLRFQAGDAACFDDLVARYRKPLLGFLYRMVRDLAACEELLQEAFLRVYLHRARYQPQARFSTWIYQIAQHLALNYIRDHRRDKLSDSLDAPAVGVHADAAPRELPDHRPTVEQALLARSISDQRTARIRAAITALPERQRTAVVLHKYQGLNYSEIGGILGLSESATKSLLFRAYESLRRDLEDLL